MVEFAVMWVFAGRLHSQTLPSGARLGRTVELFPASRSLCTHDIEGRGHGLVMGHELPQGCLSC